jgi:hypothetical protein
VTAAEGPFVDQIFFRYVHDFNGLRPVSSSLDHAETATWNTRLKSHVRLYPAADGTRPSSALSYLVFDDESAAVVWRSDTGPTAGRNDARALLGGAQILTPEVAAGLGAWDGWSAPCENGEQLDPIPADLLQSSQSGIDEMVGIAGQDDYRRAIVAVLARMLAEPGWPVSVIGRRDLTATVVVWALRRAGDEALRQRKHGLRWTFSTWETKHDNGVTGLPEIVFLHERQPNPIASIERVQVDLRQLPELTQDYDYADALVRHLLDGAGQPADPRARSQRAAAADQKRSRLEVVDFHQPVPDAGAPAHAGVTPARMRTDRQAQAVASHQPGASRTRPPPVGGTSDGPTERIAEGFTGWTDPPPGEPANGASPGKPRSHDLRATLKRGGFRRILAGVGGVAVIAAVSFLSGALFFPRSPSGDVVSKLETLQQSVDDLPGRIEQPGPTPAPARVALPDFPWTGSLLLNPPVKAVLVYVRGSDGKLRGAACTLATTPPDQPRSFTCPKPLAVGDRGTAAIIATTEGDVPDFAQAVERLPKGVVTVVMIGQAG